MRLSERNETVVIVKRRGNGSRSKKRGQNCRHNIYADTRPYLPDLFVWPSLIGLDVCFVTASGPEAVRFIDLYILLGDAI